MSPSSAYRLATKLVGEEKADEAERCLRIGLMSKDELKGAHLKVCK